MGPPNSVLTQPGWPELTFIFVSFNSFAKWIVKALRAVLDALYANSFAGEIGESLAEWSVNELKIVETLTILPASDFLISGSNFFNSEIVGKETDSVFGVVFSKLGEDFARHPAQLYEAFSYIIIFFIVAHIYWRTDKLKKTGYLFGLFFVLLWVSRFIVEFFKQAQVDGREDWIFGMNTGQSLSIPFILIGLYLMFRKTAKSQW